MDAGCRVFFFFFWEAEQYLMAALGDVVAAGGQTVLQGDAALGHGHAASVAVHRVERVTVFSIWKTGRPFSSPSVSNKPSSEHPTSRTMFL